MSDSWVKRSVLDTANTHSVVRRISSNLNISILAPRGRPRVLDQEIVHTIFLTIADSEDSVVNSGAAEESVGQNTSGVGLEVVGFSADRDRLGLQVGRLLESHVVVSSDVGVGSDSHVRCLRSVISASSISSSVGPVVLVVSTVRLVIVERVALPTTVAAEA